MFEMKQQMNVLRVTNVIRVGDLLSFEFMLLKIFDSYHISAH